MLVSVPFILIAMGILMQVLAIHTAQEVKRATAQTTATVISEEYHTEHDTTKDRHDPDYEQRVRYVTITFAINGEQRWKAGRNDELKVGEELIVWYDPDDTSGTNDRVYIEGFDDFGGEISFLGLIPLAIGIGILVYAFIPNKKNKSQTAEQDADESSNTADERKADEHLFCTGKLSDEEIAALKYKMLHPEKTVTCPRCDGEIIIKERGSHKEVRCEKRTCIRGVIPTR